jgi:hypothetical protein
VKISDRIRRWWSPAKWADDHAEILDPKLEAYAESYAATEPVPREPRVSLYGGGSDGDSK